ncbi:fucose isomerase [Treponema zioleckii]|uniref:fucose isomerase n=1 Tax=Treponema zioleckii TaxID=331680 RepID=UPI00168BF531|nr:fucose isomerase [Treponema zioleckii]
MKFNLVYIPIGVGTFHMESAQKLFEESKALLRTLEPQCTVPQKPLLTVQELSSYLEEVNPDLIILQNLTFANAAYTTEVVKRFSCPILLWTLREPVIDGGRLRLNSLTGAFSAANAIKNFRGINHQFEHLLALPTEKVAKSVLKRTIRVAKLKNQLSSLKLGLVGHTPQGFGFGQALDAELTRTFGCTLDSIEARELILRAKSYTADEILPYIEKAKSKVNGLDSIPDENVLNFAKLYKAYSEYVKNNGIMALASRCWPDFFVDFGTPVCAVLSLLNEEGVVASCEADIYGALSMYIASELSEHGVFFGDPVSLNEEENSLTFWHCGMADCSLARTDTGAAVGVHPNRKIGPTMEFGCRPSESATVFRVGRTAQGDFRLFIASGKILDKPKQFLGTTLVVKLKTDAKDLVHTAITDGWEPHFVVAYGDIAEELVALGKMLSIQTRRF